MLEELPEDDQVEILSTLEGDRAAHVLEEMEPDDAADLLSELPTEQAERLLALMEPGDADPVRRLLAYDEHTAGGLMTSDPVVLAPDATIAEALAHVRRVELTPPLASAVFVCRSPLETPTGRFLGTAHFQRLLREQPSTELRACVSEDPVVAPDAADTAVAELLASYDMLAVAVCDRAGSLLGAVTIDDVLDRQLGAGWRQRQRGVTNRTRTA